MKKVAENDLTPHAGGGDTSSGKYSHLRSTVTHVSIVHQVLLIPSPQVITTVQIYGGTAAINLRNRRPRTDLLGLECEISAIGMFVVQSDRLNTKKIFHYLVRRSDLSHRAERAAVPP
jgi:hypothetical protein